MFKVLVRSHLDYCDIIYHIPSKQDHFGVTLSYLMEKIERIQYQAALALAHGRVQIAPNCMTNWAGNPYLIVVGADAYQNYTRFCVTKPLLISKTNCLHSSDPCTVKIVAINFMAYGAKHLDI